jgi:hypothetical protein
MAEYTINTLAKRMGVADRTLRRWVQQGLVKPVRVDTKTIEVPIFDETTLDYVFSLKFERAKEALRPLPARLLERTQSGLPFKPKRKRDRSKERLNEILPREPWRMHEVPSLQFEFERQQEPSGEFAPLPTKEWAAPEHTPEAAFAPSEPHSEPLSPPPEPTPPPPEASPAPTEPSAAIPPGERLRALEAKMGDTVEFRRLRTLVRTLTNDGLSDSAIGFAIDEYLKELAAEADEFEPEEEDQ